MLLIKELPQQSNSMIFPGIWLRDNCQCAQCFHRDSLSRKPLRWNNFDTKVKVRDVTVSVLYKNSVGTLLIKFLSTIG